MDRVIDNPTQEKHMEVGLNYKIPADLHRALKALAAQRGHTLKQEIVRALTVWATNYDEDVLDAEIVRLTKEITGD